MTVSPTMQAYLMATILWLSLVGFAALGGADFGAGVWDLLARTSDAAEEQRGALIRAIGPIWEANELWIIFAITGTWTAFPLVFSTVMTALFVPLTVGLIGLVLRGAAFAYYTHFRHSALGQGTKRALTDGALGLTVTAATLFGRDALQRWRERRAQRNRRRV